MLAVSPVAVTPASLAVPPSAIAVTATDLVSTRQTLVAVAAPLSNSPVANDEHNSAAQATAAPTGETESSAGPSTTFLTQLISQSEGAQEDNQIAVATSFSRFAPAPQYIAFVGYSVVKFRPSDAGLPSGYATTAPAPSAEETTQPAADYRAYSTTQSRNSSNLVSSEPHLSVAG